MFGRARCSKRSSITTALFLVLVAAGACQAAADDRRPVALADGWTYYAEEPGDTIETVRAAAAGEWRPYRPGDNLFPEHSAAHDFIWLRGELPAEFPPATTALMVTNPLGLHLVYLDDRLIRRTGPLAPGSEFAIDVRRYWPILDLPTDPAGRTIYMRISVGGVFPVRGIRAPLLGDRHELRNQLFLTAGSRSFMGIFYCTLALFVFLLYLVRRENIYGSFALLCFSMGMYTLADHELAYYFSGSSSVWYDWPQTFLVFIPVGLFGFLECIFGPGPWRWIRRAWQFYLAFAIFSNVAIHFGLIRRWILLDVFLIIIAPMVLLVPIMTIIRSLRAHETEARVFTLGLLIFTATMARDIVRGQNVFATEKVIFFWGGLAFILSLAIIVVRRFFEARRQLEIHARDLEDTNRAMARFVPTPFLEFIGRTGIVDVRLGDQVQKEMTVLFTDIRSFTTLSESMSPAENFDFINDYLKTMGPVIRRHNGFIDKYIGDAIMALFPGPPDDALHAALEMRARLADFNRERSGRGLSAIDIGIGIHTGRLMLGMVGEEERMEGTVIADAVNLASRLEGLTKKLGKPIIFSEASHDLLHEPDSFAPRYVGRVRVKGKQEPVRVFECGT